MATDRSAGNWAKIEGQHGIYERVGNPLPLQEGTKAEKLQQTIKSLKTRMETVIAEANKRSRR